MSHQETLVQLRECQAAISRTVSAASLPLPPWLRAVVLPRSLSEHLYPIAYARWCNIIGWGAFSLAMCLFIGLLKTIGDTANFQWFLSCVSVFCILATAHTLLTYYFNSTLLPLLQSTPAWKNLPLLLANTLQDPAIASAAIKRAGPDATCLDKLMKEVRPVTFGYRLLHLFRLEKELRKNNHLAHMIGSVEDVMKRQYANITFDCDVCELSVSK